MSTNIESKVLEMKFDNAQFEAAVAKTMSTLDKFKDKLNFKNAGDGLEKVSKKTSDYQYTLQDIGQSLTNLEHRFSVMGTVGARIFERLTDAAMGFVSRGIQNIVGSITQGGMSRAMNLEQARFQMQGILKDSEKVHRVIYDDILPELQGTPFSLDQAAVVIGQLVASGKTSSEQIKRATRGMAGLAAMTGHSFEDVGRIFTKVAGNGVMMAEELNQLSGYGVNAAADLANFYKGVEKGSYKATKQTLKDMEAIKKTFGEFTEGTIREAASKRLIHYGSMAAAMDELYGAHAQKSTQMYTGALEDLKAALARIGAEPAALRLNFLRDAFNALVPAVDAVNAVIKPFWNASRSSDKAFKKVEEYVKPFQGPLAQKVQKAGWEFQKLFVQLDKNNEIVRATQKSYKKLGLEWDKEAKVFRDLKTGMEYDDKQALMNPDMLRAITASTQGFVNVVIALGKSLKAVGRGLKNALPKPTLKGFADLTERFRDFTSKLIPSSKNLHRFGTIAQAVFTPLGLAIRGAIGAFKILWDVLGRVYKATAPTREAFMQMITAFAHLVIDIGIFIRELVGAGDGIASFAMKLLGSTAKLLHLDKVAQFLQNTFIKMAGVFTNISNDVGGFLTTLVGRIQQFGKTVSDFLHLETAIKTLKEFFGVIKTGIAEALHIEELADAFMKFWTPLKELITNSKFWKVIASAVLGFINKLKEIIPFADIIDRLTNSFERFKTTVSGFTEGPTSKIRKWFEKAGKSLSEFYGNLDESGVVEKWLKSNIKPLNLIKGIQSKIQKYVIPAAQTIGEVLSSFLGYENISSMFQAAVKKIGSAFESLGHVFDWFIKSGKDGAEGVKSATETLFNKKLFGSFSKVGENFAKISGPISDALDRISETIAKVTSKADPQKAKQFLIMVGILGMAVAYMRTMYNAKKTIDAITGLISAFGGIGLAIQDMFDAFSGIGKAIKGVTNAVKVGIYLMAMAGAFVVIAAAIKILSTLNTEQIIAGVLAMITTLGMLMGMVYLLGKLDLAKDGNRIMKLGVSIGSMGAALLAMAVAMRIIAGLWSEDSMGSFGAAVGSIVIFILAMAAAARIMSGTTSFQADIGKVAAAFIGMAQGIKMLVGALVDLTKVEDVDSMDHALSVIVAIIAMMSIFSLSNFHQGNVAGAALGMLALGMALSMITKSLKSLAKAMKDGKDIKGAEDVISEIVVFMGLFALALGGMSKLGGSGKTAMATVLAMGIFVKMMASSLSEISGLAKDGSLNQAKEAIEEFMVIMTLISLISMLGGKSAAAGPAALAALAASLGLLGLAIAYLGTLSLDQLAMGFYAIAGALIAAIGGLALFSLIVKGAFDLQTAAAIAALGLAMGTFAASIYLLAQLPWQNLLVAMGGLIGIMIAAAVVMAAFGGLSPLMLGAALAFLAVGAAALFVGAGIFLVTVALSALVPLIQTLAGADIEKLQQGMNVLIFIAAGLAEAFKVVASGLDNLGAALIAVAIGTALFGVSILVVAASVVVASVAVLMLAGSFAVLASVLDAFVPTIKDSVIGTLGSLIGAVGGFFDKIMQKTDEVNEKQQIIAEKTNQQQKKSMDDINKTTEEGTEKVAQTQSELFNNPTATTAAQTGGTNLGNEFNVNLNEALASGDLSPSMDSLFSTVDTSVLSDKANELGVEFPSDFGNALEANAGAAKPGGKALVKAAADGAGGAGGSSLFTKAADSGVDKYASTVGKGKGVKDKGKSMAKKGVAGAKSENNEGFRNAGENAAKGFANGMDAGISAYVTPKARELARRAKEAAMAELGEQSPSKVFMGIGRYVSIGFAIGIDSMRSRVEQSSEGMASTSITAAQMVSDAINTALSVDDLTPKITPVVDLSNVSQSANEINRTFGRAFGLSSPFGSMNAAFAAASFNSAHQNDRFKSIDRLSKKIAGMTETMNSRTLNVYNTIDGSTDPEAFADGLIRSFRLNARTV